MPSNTPGGRKWLSVLMLGMLALPLCACATPIETTRPASSCATLVPDAWRAGVAGAPLPGAGAVVGDWISFADEQTGNLDTANGRETQTLQIVETCEARDAALVKQLTHKPLLGLF